MSHVQANLRSIRSAGGFDAVIVSTNSPHQRDYWEQRLKQTGPELLSASAEVHVIYEDWPGGAGNGLGTLYVLQKLPHLLERLKKGASVALYHTAGKGTRLAPLPAAEANNKSKVKLPGLLAGQTITLLEAVIRQTSLYAQHRPGRLSVFWGDQIFLPTELPQHPQAHVEILCRSQPTADAATWEQRGYSHYGLIIDNRMQVEKVSYATYQRLAGKSLAISLGCFNTSYELTKELLSEFGAELRSGKGSLNSDPHFWMPLSLNATTFQELGGKPDHHSRMQRLRDRLPAGPLLAGEDIGQHSHWWDFGQLGKYYDNSIKLAQDSDEGDLLRQFFGVTRDAATGCCLIGTAKSAKGCRDSVLINVDVAELAVERALLVDCHAPRIDGRDCLVYNVRSRQPISLKAQEVLAGVSLPNQMVELKTNLKRHGGEDWSVRLPGNALSYAEAYEAQNGSK